MFKGNSRYALADCTKIGAELAFAPGRRYDGWRGVLKMTECLYYDQSYLTEFDANVLNCEAVGGGFDVTLDRTAFYPTSGGQPHDTGLLGGARVMNVWLDERHVAHHLLDAPLEAGAAVRGRIDWARRFDHMQQHTADHMIAGVIWRMHQGYTVGLHLGEAFSTIDIVMPDGATRFSDQRTREIERLVNSDIQRDLPVRCFFPDARELARLPLRKQPTVDENIRVVMIGEEECVACGGTHVSGAGQVGPVKILWTAPSRGKLRLAFVAGMRAIADYQARYDATERAAALLSCKPSELPKALEAALERAQEVEQQLGAFKRRRALDAQKGLLERAEPLEDGWRLVAETFDDLEMDALKELAKRLTEQPNLYALLGIRQGEGLALLFASSPGGVSMGELMKEVTGALGGKGGGRPEFAQGAAPVRNALDFAKEKLLRIAILRRYS